MEEVRDFFEAVTRQLGSCSRGPDEGQPNPSNSESGKGKKRKPKLYGNYWQLRKQFH